MMTVIILIIIVGVAWFIHEMGKFREEQPATASTDDLGAESATFEESTSQEQQPTPAETQQLAKQLKKRRQKMTRARQLMAAVQDQAEAAADVFDTDFNDFSNTDLMDTAADDDADYGDGNLQMSVEFTFVYEDQLDAVFLVFKDQDGLNSYRRLVRNLKDSVAQLYELLQQNMATIREQVGASATANYYLLKMAKTGDDLDDIVEKVTNNPQCLNTEVALKFDSDGQLLGGEMAEILAPDLQVIARESAAEFQQLLSWVNYFVNDGQLVVYSKNTAFGDELTSKYSRGIWQATHFCHLLQLLQFKAQHDMNLPHRLPLLMLPGPAESDQAALTVFAAMTQTVANPMSKSYVALDAQGHVYEGVMVQTPEAQKMLGQDYQPL